MFSIYNSKKIIAVILVLTLLCGALVSCGGNDEEVSTEPVVENTTHADSDNSEPEAEGEKVVLASNGKSDFTIWVESDIYSNYPDIVKQINDVAKLIKNKTGATIEVISDSSYSVKASKKPGILIGNTKFAESKAMNTEMKNKDYYVGLSGDKILLFGGDVDGVSKAVRYFYITVLNSQKVVDKTMVFDTAVHTLRQTEKYDINSIKCAGIELGKFNIVISADANVNENYFAYAIRYWLYQKYGYRMNIVLDSTAESEHEILVGNTERKSVASLETDEYSISVSDGKLCLAAGGMISYNQMYSYITGTLFKAGGSADYTLDRRLFSQGFRCYEH